MKTFPLQYTAASAAGQMSFHLPKAVQYEGNPVLAATDDQEFAGQDATYISVIPTAGVLPDPIDAYYAYVATHDGSEIWLATAGHPLGPWTWRRAVLELSATSFTKHISSPSAVMHNGEVTCISMEYTRPACSLRRWQRPVTAYISSSKCSP